jgi:hypothetical protein
VTPEHRIRLHGTPVFCLWNHRKTDLYLAELALIFALTIDGFVSGNLRKERLDTLLGIWGSIGHVQFRVVLQVSNIRQGGLAYDQDLVA